MNIQPGMGLGFTGSKQIAFGLGTDFLIHGVEDLVVILPEAGGGGKKKIKVKLPDRRIEMMKLIHKDDDDVIKIITRIVTGGYL